MTDKQKNTLIAWDSIDIVTYGLTLAYAIHNTYKFLYLQGRWNTFFLTGFYVLTVLICLSRIASCFLNLATVQD